MINLLLVGLGPHAQKCFYPILAKYGKQWQAKIVCGVDVENKKADIERYFIDQNGRIEIYYVPDHDVGKKKLRNEVKKKLAEWTNKFRISGIIIATEPLSHYAYADWALEKGLSILLDKPITTSRGASTSLEAAKNLIIDYKRLEKKYFEAKNNNPKIIFSVLCQRRYHKGINKMKELIDEVFRRTNCPVTFIQATHGDGQWRMPNEIIDLSYHGFNSGYGVCSHSGYLFFDTLLYLMRGAPKIETKINRVEVVANFLRPKDLISQLQYQDYLRIFPEFFTYNSYSKDKYNEKVKGFGEVDAFVTLNFKSQSRIITVGSINLFHNSLSQRGWLSCLGRDLYKGNGRIGHESYQIIQGPFQTIYCNSFKSEGTEKNNGEGIFEMGGEYHMDIHVFRNQKLFPDWQNYQLYKARDLGIGRMRKELWGQQQEARLECIKEFIAFLQGKMTRKNLKSEFPTHRNGIILLSAAYQSGGKRFLGKNPLVKVNLSNSKNFI